MAERLVSDLKDVNISKIYYQDKGLTIGSSTDKFQLIETEFAAAPFRVNADNLVFLVTCKDAVVRKILDCLCGRATVKKLDLSTCLVSDDMDQNLFNQMLQELKITEMEVQALSPPFWQLPAVKQMTSVKCRKCIPMPLGYLAETAFEYCAIGCENKSSNSTELNSVLKKWADGEKEIKNWTIDIPRIDDKELFKGFYKPSKNRAKNRRRPLVTISSSREVFADANVEREDGKQLFLKYRDHDNSIWLQDTPFDQDNDDK